MVSNISLHSEIITLLVLLGLCFFVLLTRAGSGAGFFGGASAPFWPPGEGGGPCCAVDSRGRAVGLIAGVLDHTEQAVPGIRTAYVGGRNRLAHFEMPNLFATKCHICVCKLCTVGKKCQACCNKCLTCWATHCKRLQKIPECFCERCHTVGR